MNRQSTTKTVLLLTVCAALMAFASLAPVVRSQTPAGGSAQDLVKQNVAVAKQAAADDQAAQKQYTWVERTTLSLKGEAKNVSLAQVNYDVYGKLQKTPLSASPAPDKKFGLRGKIAESKTEDMKAYMKQVKALVGEYVPPSPTRMQEAAAAGRVALSIPRPDAVQLMFTDYARAGDRMALVFDTATKKIRHIDISSALENKDPVTMSVEFQTLPDSTHYAGVTTVDAPAKQVQVKVEQINFQKTAR